jgi:hypothetical protein
MENPGAQVLNEKFNLNTSTEVNAAERRAKVMSGEKITQKVEARVQNYLNRLQFVLNNEDPQKRERARRLLRSMLYNKYIVKPDEIVDYRLRTDQRIARQQGHGYIEINDDVRALAYRELSGVIQETIGNQTESLDEWIDYLLSDDAAYPDWLKYYAFRNILSLASYDKQKREFPKRSISVIDWSTLKEFPELNREALAYVLDEIEKKYQGVTRKEEIRRLLQGENFAKLYAQAFEKATQASVNRLSVTQGQWVKFDQGSNPQPLVDSLQGHGTGWCTAGESTASYQLQSGDFYVYYSQDEQGKFTVPRVAIRMEGNRIDEVRGIAENQNLDPYVGDIVQEKLAELPDGQAYQKKTSDMRMLTTIENKMNSSKSLTRNELIFLYEINGTIEGFGYQRDPRIAEIRSKRDPKKDASVVLDCTTSEIALNRNEVSEHTKAYIGPLFPGIFEELGDIVQIYTSFPKGRVFRDKVIIRIKDRKKLLNDMEIKNINISPTAEEMIESLDFMPNADRLSGIKWLFGKETSTPSELIEVVRLKVRDLGFTNCPTTDQLFAKVQEFGLELCPAEVGPQYRLQYIDQPRNDCFYIGMKPVVASNRPDVFRLKHDAEGLLLSSTWAAPDDEWGLDDTFVFRLCKSS